VDSGVSGSGAAATVPPDNDHYDYIELDKLTVDEGTEEQRDTLPDTYEGLRQSQVPPPHEYESLIPNRANASQDANYANIPTTVSGAHDNYLQVIADPQYHNDI